MLSIKFYTILFIFLFPLSVYSESDSNKSDTEKSVEISKTKNIMDISLWEENIKSLSDVAGEKWASLMTSTSVNAEKFKEAISETWNNVLGDTQANKEVSEAGSAIINFISNEVNNTKESTAHSATLIENGKFVDGIWYLSTHLVKDTDTNLANAVKESELLNTLGKITATSYAGPQGAAAYASWYAFKETKNPEMALKMGIMSGATQAGFLPIHQDSISEVLKNNIISGVMAGLSAAVAGEDEKSIKDAFLNSTLKSLKKTSLTKTIKEKSMLVQDPITK